MAGDVTSNFSNERVSSVLPNTSIAKRLDVIACTVCGVAGIVIAGLGIASVFGPLGSTGFVASLVGGGMAITLSVSGIIWIVISNKKNRENNLGIADSSPRPIESTGSELSSFFTSLRDEIIKTSQVAQNDETRMLNAMMTPFHSVVSDIVYIGNYSCYESLSLSRTDVKNADEKTYELPEITRVISVTHQVPEGADLKGTSTITEYLCLRPTDTEEGWALLSGNFNFMFNMIDRALREQQPILVHCTQGESRSAIVVIAYLMHRCNVTYEQALNFVKDKRYVVGPNPELVERLKSHVFS